ncbi:MAG: 3-methyl-2-oxobutanoate hydroxymethyltransferase [Bacillota bacterium]|nr:3-methyl-2-oxobutanoate hydroxymethyltransferase [Bacillota bacterium]
MGRLTLEDLRAMKRRGEKIPMLTAYDYPVARILDEAGIPLLLVGDSLGMVVLGYASTIPVTMEDMIRHTRAVVSGSRRAFIVADLPFMTYSISVEEALRNAARLIQEGGAQAVKLEGGFPVLRVVRRLVEAGIPVMGHLGLTPQAIHQLGGYRVQGKNPEAAQRLLEEARALEKAGAFAVVLECIPSSLAAEITANLSIPTLGIGAGPDCDGQVQVISDLIGLFPDFLPRHACRYVNVAQWIRRAALSFARQVRAGTFTPGEGTLEEEQPEGGTT